MNGIKTLEIFNLSIPFNVSFKHNSAERNSTQSVIVKANDGQISGYGESCPREYVTNESIQSVFTFFNQHKNETLKKITNLDSLLQFHDENYSLINNNLAAWCAIELALLDLFAKQQKCSIEKLLNLPELSGTFQYTAVIGDMPMNTFEKFASKYIEIGFSDFKIKISGQKIPDFEKIVFLKSLNNNFKIRLDANNCWNNVNESQNYLENIPCEISGIEEPLVSKDLDSLNNLSKKISTTIILDESFCRYEELKKIENNPNNFIINLRVSKMGGLINSLKIAEAAIKKNIGIIIGSQVGESSILTRAGLTVANAIENKQKAMEGAFGTLLLQYDIVKNSLMFGKGGKLNPDKYLNREINGFQLKIEEKYLV